jgi:hypothetical protein
MLETQISQYMSGKFDLLTDLRTCSQIHSQTDHFTVTLPQCNLCLYLSFYRLKLTASTPSVTPLGE